MTEKKPKLIFFITKAFWGGAQKYVFDLATSRKYQENFDILVVVGGSGALVTNFKTIQKTFRKLEKLESLKASGDLQTKYTKKEALMIEREIEKLKKLFEGISSIKRLPEAIFVTDVKHEGIAVKEANKSKVKTIGVVDTNTSPDGVDYVIPCNDDATKATELVVNFMAAAINEGRQTQITVSTAPAVVKAETKS
jgi:ribosomal protein S2